MDEQKPAFATEARIIAIDPALSIAIGWHA
jgi:hypothetical protein